MIRRMRKCCIQATAVALLGLVICSGPSANGFVIEDNLKRLTEAARWPNTSGTLIEENVRGLGGGLEYALSDDFCPRLRPSFADSASCTEIEQALRDAFRIWTDDHPVLRATNVSDQVQVRRPPDGADPWAGFGAEVDFFAARPTEFGAVQGLGAYTSTWWRNSRPIGTNGRLLAGSTLTNADVTFNAEACFYLDPRHEGSNCNHFTTLAAHEIGHVLGLDHPNEFPSLNWDTDDDPHNAMAIDCQDPANGLRQSTQIDPNTLMNPRASKQVFTSLTNDDRAGRDFLYPVCD